MEVLYESHSKSLGLRQQKTTEKSHIILDSICLIGWNIGLFDAYEVQQNSRKQSLQITQYFIFYQKDRKWTDFKLSDLASVSKIKGLENVSPELETIAKLKTRKR